jgi:hypothetical protein
MHLLPHREEPTNHPLWPSVFDAARRRASIADPGVVDALHQNEEVEAGDGDPANQIKRAFRGDW